MTRMALRIRTKRSPFRQAALRGLLVGAICFLAQNVAYADALPQPQGKVLIVVTGDIEYTNNGAEAQFDRAMLDSLGVTKMVTATAWHPQGTEFAGVLARRLMEAVGAKGDTVTATAANDYKVTIPIEDFTKYDVLLATHIDGEELRLRTKGPIWVIYPEGVDLPPHVRQERMIWQLIEFRVD
jgi:hypothetical protein